MTALDERQERSPRQQLQWSVQNEGAEAIQLGPGDRQTDRADKVAIARLRHVWRFGGMDVEGDGKRAKRLDEVLHPRLIQVEVNFRSSYFFTMADTFVDIGELARRSGLAASALRFYEATGLIEAVRSPGRRRRFPRSTLRKIAFIRAAQNVGLSLDAIKDALATLPQGRAPTKADWEGISTTWTALLDERIAALVRLRNSLGSCIGCGCLSLESCALYNPQDIARSRGAGARYLLGDKPA